MYHVRYWDYGLRPSGCDRAPEFGFPWTLYPMESAGRYL
jgi:hypothetical protein